MALVSIPGGIANGLLAGVNPIYGVYSMIAGTTVTALFTSSVIMNVDSTGATALATFDALGDVAPEDQLGRLVVLSLLVGMFMLVLGFLKLGFLVRFISNSVMVGFLSGLGVLTILGQVGDLTGYASDKGNKVARTIDTVLNWPEIDGATLLVGLLTIAVIVAVNRTRFDKYSFLVGVVFTTIVVATVSAFDVALVGDSTDIPRSCYPIGLLGLPPVWYKSAPYRSRAVLEPREVLAEFGTEVDDDVEVRVWDSNSEVRYLVLPQRPSGTEGWTEERLAELVGRNAMIGVERARGPEEATMS
jgi:MFS superfamily sulfate permease-like transporter